MIIGFLPLSKKPMFKGKKKGANPFISSRLSVKWVSGIPRTK